MQWPCLHRPQELRHVRHKSLLMEEILCRSKRHHSFSFAWFQASAAMWMRSAIFCDFTQRGMMVSYRRFGTTCRPHLQGTSSPRKTAWSLKMERIGCSETWVRNNHSTLRKIPKERKSPFFPELVNMLHLKNNHYGFLANCDWHKTFVCSFGINVLK